MRYECMKLARQVHVKAIFLAVAILSALLGAAGVGASTSLVDIEEGTYVKGKAAFENERRKYEAAQEDITVGELNEALRDIQSCPDEWVAASKAMHEYPGIGNLLIDAYAAMDGHFTLFEVENADDFYERHEAEVKLAIEGRGQPFSKKETEDILAWAGKVREPYKNEFAIPWRRFYTSVRFVLMMDLFAAIVYASGLFSYEKRMRMDLVIGTMGHGAVRKIVSGKAKALALLTCVQYLASMASLCLAYFAGSGPIAWKGQIQTLFFTSILPLTYGQLFCVSLLSGLFACLAVAFFAAALNAKLLGSTPVMAVGVAVTFVPALLRDFKMLPNSVMKFVQVLPVNAALVQNNASSFYLYPFPGHGLPGIFAILAVSVLLLCAFAFCSVRIARKHMCMD